MGMGAKRKARGNAAKKKPASPSKAKEHFVRGVIVRGEAVPKGEPLVPGATHEVIATDQEGNLAIRRRRFSLA
jgi:hypothetical protein